MFKFATQPLSIVKIWMSGFGLCKSSFSKVWYLLLAFLFFGMIYMPTLKIIYKFSLPYQIVFNLVFYLLLIFIGMVLFHRMYMLVLSHIKLKASISYVAARFYVILGAMLSLLAIYAIGIILGFGPDLVSHSVWYAEYAPLYGNVFKLLFAISRWLGVIYMLVIMIFSIFFIPLILFENKGCWSSIRASWKLVKGNWWRTAVVLIIPLAAKHLVVYLLGMIGFIYLHYIIVDIIGLVFYLFFIAVQLVQYNDLKLRKIVA